MVLHLRQHNIGYTADVARNYWLVMHVELVKSWSMSAQQLLWRPCNQQQQFWSRMTPISWKMKPTAALQLPRIQRRSFLWDSELLHLKVI